MKSLVKKILFIGLIALLSVSIIACSSNNNTGSNAPKDVKSDASNGDNAAAGEYEFPEMTIRLAGTTADTSSQIVGANKFAELVGEKTGGKVKVEVYPNLQLGSLREQAEMAQMGSVEMSISLVSTLSSFDDTLQVLEYPYVFPSEEAKLWEVVEGKSGDLVKESLQSKGFHALGIWAGGYKALTTKNPPILSPDDLKKMKFRVIPSETLIEQYKAWGANPTPIDFAELYTALQSNVVDGQENPLETIVTQNHFEVQSNVMIMNAGYQFHMLVANKAWYDGLDPKLQQVLNETEEEARMYARDYNSSRETENLQTLIDKGMTSYELTPEQIQPFIDLSLPLHDKLAKTDLQKELLQTIRDGIAANK